MGSATGATIHLHYCMGKLVEWGFWKNKSKNCDNCGMDKKSTGYADCCKDDHKQFKLDDNQKITVVDFKWMPQHKTLLTHFPVTQTFNIEIVPVLEKKYLTHAPPRIQNIPVFLRNCVFLI